MASAFLYWMTESTTAAEGDGPIGWGLLGMVISCPWLMELVI